MAKSASDSKLMEYKDTIRQLNTVINSQNELIVSLQKTIASNNEQMEKLQEKIDYLTQKLFGTSSEKSKNLPGQISLFNEAEEEAPPQKETDSDEDTVTVKEYTRKAKRTLDETFRNVPVEEVVIPLSEDQKYCSECGAAMKVIGKEYVRSEFEFTPAKGKLIKYYRETAKCPVCSEKSAMERNIEFVKAHVPQALMPNSYASASAVAWVMYQKYVNSIPLYRQEQDWNQMGVYLNRATLANWIIYCAKSYFTPLCDFFHKELLKRKFAMADETRVQVLKEPGRNAETDSFMWLYRSGEDGLPPIIIFKYTETRARYNAAEFLSGFKGYLQTDGYQGYNNLPDIKRCCCWAHYPRSIIIRESAEKYA